MKPLRSLRLLSGLSLRPSIASLRIVPSQRRAIGSISAFDSIIFRNLFGTDEIRKASPQHPPILTFSPTNQPTDLQRRSLHQTMRRRRNSPRTSPSSMRRHPRRRCPADHFESRCLSSRHGPPPHRNRHRRLPNSPSRAPTQHPVRPSWEVPALGRDDAGHHGHGQRAADQGWS